MTKRFKLAPLSASAVTDFQTCARRAVFLRCYGIKPRLESMPLKRGSLWGKIMDAYWQHGIEAARERAAGLRQDQTEAFAHDEDLPKLHDTLLAVLEHYHLHHGGIEGTLEGVETAFEMQLPGRGGPFIGFRDKIIRDKDGLLWVLDHKLMVGDVRDWYGRNGHRMQAAMYLYATMVEQGGEPPAGFIYDITRFMAPTAPGDFPVLKDGSRLSKTMPSGATAASLRAAIRMHGFREADYAEVLKELDEKDGAWFLRLPVPYDLETIQGFEEELAYAAADIDAKRGHALTILEGVDTDPLTGDAYAADGRGDLQGADLRKFVALKYGRRFPGNPAICNNSYGKPCLYAGLCLKGDVSEVIVSADGKYDEQARPREFDAE